MSESGPIYQILYLFSLFKKKVKWRKVKDWLKLEVDGGRVKVKPSTVWETVVDLSDDGVEWMPISFAAM